MTRLCLLPKLLSKVKSISCFIRHEIKDPTFLKFEYLKNEKSFRSKIFFFQNSRNTSNIIFNNNIDNKLTLTDINLWYDNN